MQQHWKSIATYSTLGLELGGSVLVGLFGGRWLDGKLGTDGWLTFAGLIVGVLAGYRTLWRALRRANQMAAEEERQEQAERKQFHDRHGNQ